MLCALSLMVHGPESGNSGSMCRPSGFESA